MNLLFLAFLIVQTSLLLFMALHDWLSIPPLTDIRALEKHDNLPTRLISSAINTITVFILLSLTWYYLPTLPRWVAITLVVSYGILTIGTILAWWVPYLFGHHTKSRSLSFIYGDFELRKQEFSIYKNTHHFLPEFHGNTVPNTLHVLLHLQVWFCFIVSLYLFTNS